MTTETQYKFLSPPPSSPLPPHIIKFIISGLSIIGMEAAGLKWRVSHMCLEKIRIIAIRSKEKTDTMSVYQTLGSNKGPEVLRLHFLIFLNLFNLNWALLDVIDWLQTSSQEKQTAHQSQEDWVKISSITLYLPTNKTQFSFKLPVFLFFYFIKAALKKYW